MDRTEMKRFGFLSCPWLAFRVWASLWVCERESWNFKKDPIYSFPNETALEAIVHVSFVSESPGRDEHSLSLLHSSFPWNAWELVCKRPFLRFWASTAFSSKGSDLYRAYLTRLCYTFRFSQPLGVFFHQCSFGLVSYRIHPWGFAFRGFPLSEAATALAALCPSSKMSEHVALYAPGNNATERSVLYKVVLPGLCKPFPS
jgi:hypothetical protein